MYTSNELEALSVTFDSQMRQLEKDVMSDIIRRISINGEITRAADWQINRLIEMGALREDIEKSIKHSLKMTDKEIEELFREVAESGYARNDEIYKKAGIKNIPFEDNTVLQQLIAAVGKQTAEEMTNISQSLGFAVRNSDGSLSFKPIAKYYQDTLDNAINGIANGVFDYNTAIKRAVSEMTKSGLRTVDYASGWSNRVDVAARRAIMTGFSQVTGKMNEQNAEKLHTDTFEATWHSGARPSHQQWQGKWYTHDELVSVCGLGTVTGLHGANCYHDYFPVIPGISVPTYTAEELEEMNRKENIPVEYNGKKYTKYEALQRQRRLETTMRAQRQQIHLLKVGNADEDDIIAARCRYRVTSQKYKRFSEAMELPEQRQRVTVDGLGNIGLGKWKKSIDNKEKSGIMNTDKYYAGFSFKGQKHKRKGRKERFEKVNPDFLDSLPRLKIAETPEQSTYNANIKDYQNNCQRSVPVWELRMRGYDVIASKISERSDDVGRYAKQVYFNSDWINCNSDSARKEIEKFLFEQGDGARVAIAADISFSSHMFAATNDKGIIKWLDPLTGEAKAEKFFKEFLIDRISFCRTDNADFSNLIKECIELEVSYDKS